MMQRLDPRPLLRRVIIAIVRPYVRRELPGWGKIYSALVGDYRREAFWAGTGKRTVVLKSNGMKMVMDLSKWGDRLTFFLGRWHNAEVQAVVAAVTKSGDTVVDIGANTGEFTLCAAAAVGNTGRVICYEPNPSCVNYIRSLIELNGLTNVTVRPVGLSDRQEILALKIPAINDGEATFGPSPYSDVQTVNVEVKVGDEDLVGIEPTLIKIDVEGFEVHALNGLRKTLSRCRPVVVTEVFDPHLIRCGTSRQHLNSLMDELGYECYEVDERTICSTGKLRLGAPRTDGSLFDAVWLPRDRRDLFAAYTS